MSQTAPGVYDYEMGYTEPEFEKTLKSGFTAKSSVYHWVDAGKSEWNIGHSAEPMNILISIKKAPDRRIASLSLPVLKVTFTVNETAESEVDAFFDRFFKYFHKGGG